LSSFFYAIEAGKQFFTLVKWIFGLGEWISFSYQFGTKMLSDGLWQFGLPFLFEIWLQSLEFLILKVWKFLASIGHRVFSATDQIGQIFTHWSSVYYGVFWQITEVAHI
jgi:hypothetical protein